MRLGRKVSVPLSLPPTPSPEVLVLRSNWKWAYLSHFLFIFNPILHLEDIQLSELEDDLASGTYSVIPTVMQRLLTSLTPHDKRSILENWQHQLRKQSIKRSFDDNLMGTEDDPVDFQSLVMTEKLELFYRVCEWHFQNPNSLRTRMRDDDEYANWRIQPIAYDARGAAYWLLGGNRLWKQYSPRRKIVPRQNKRKRATSDTVGATTAVNGRASVRRKQSVAEKPSPSQKTVASRPSSTLLTRKPVRDTRSQAAGLPSARPRIIGTRASSRLRGKEEEWQEIPEEWLKESIAEASKISGPKGGSDGEKGNTSGDKEGKEKEQSDVESAFNFFDDDSELTSLSDLSELPDEEKDQKSETEINHHNDDAGYEESSFSSERNYSAPTQESWETEWEEFTKQFEKSSNTREKAFYKLLVNEIVPAITEVLKVEVKKQVLEDAMVQRKRSSRLAIKESLREAERMESMKKAEARKEMERHRRWEARMKKEEEERLKLESMRSVRLKEKAGIFSYTTWNIHDDVKTETMTTNETTPTNLAVNTKDTSDHVSIAYSRQGSNSKSGTQTPKEDEPWELDCEICHIRGWNLDDGQELMCCEICNKWQHIRCHDQADLIAGQPRRDWEQEEFICNACKTREQVNQQRLQGKHLERIQSHSSLAHYSQLPKLQLRPHQQQQLLYPPHPQQLRNAPSHNWIIYNGATGANIMNGKSTSPSNATTSEASKGKDRSNDAYSTTAEPAQRSIYGHDHPYPYVAIHRPSEQGNSYSVASSSNLQSPRSMACYVPSSTAPPSSTAALVPANGYLSNHSSHYPVSNNSNSVRSQYDAAQRLYLATSSHSSSIPQHETSSPEPLSVWMPRRYPEVRKTFQSPGKLDNGLENSEPRSDVSVGGSVLAPPTPSSANNVSGQT